MTIGSLFAGIGGLELGLEWAGLGPTVWQVEKDEMCRRVLARHWPEALRYDDVCDVGGSTLAPVDLICAGFPCQDISSAGKRAGLAGARSGLWYECARVLAECRPKWVVIENVRSGAKNWVDAVRGDLERIGYASLPIPIAASDLGAPHERARVFVVGCIADCDRERGRARRSGRPDRGRARARDEAPQGTVADAESLQRLAAKNDAFADADRAAVRLEHRRGGGSGRSQARKLAGARAHVDRTRQPQQSRAKLEVGRWPCDADRCWTAEPDVARVAVGLPGRVDRERALGNSVVPQCAEVVGQVIRQLMRGAE